ncbi:MAG: glycoside hydrolase family 97 catalytic domain-containing protein, partial [Syntrophothermus sp.]
AVITEADLEDYPGMYVNTNESGKGFKGVYAPYPLETEGGKNSFRNLIPVKRGDYIAKTAGTRSFPWRVVAVSENDKDLLVQDIVIRLASAPRLSDWSWVKPGQAAWDWWNDWNISHVDFKSGINTETYKYYIDFASANKISYIILDEGWSETLDLFKLRKEVDLPALLEYGKSKNVGLVLWATWAAVLKQMDTAFAHYSKLGVKGFKIDFIDRDDQYAVASTYEIADKAARNKLFVDYHGIFKPTGLQHTYPNVIGYEGVMGLENYKWAVQDQPRYCASIPFIRMVAGPMDYTPGAMRNAGKRLYHPQNSNPMSMGTRCSQLAMYVIFYAPFQMLADNPTIYMKEQECTDFITGVPTIFDESIPLDGKVGEYAALARKKGDTWFAAAMTNWTPRDLTLDLSFLGEGNYRAVIFKDGVNADREATDYKKEEVTVTSKDKLSIRLFPGGGFAARFEKMDSK